MLLPVPSEMRLKLMPHVTHLIVSDVPTKYVKPTKPKVKMTDKQLENFIESFFPVQAEPSDESIHANNGPTYDEWFCPSSAVAINA